MLGEDIYGEIAFRQTIIAKEYYERELNSIKRWLDSISNKSILSRSAEAIIAQILSESVVSCIEFDTERKEEYIDRVIDDERVYRVQLPIKATPKISTAIRFAATNFNAENSNPDHVYTFDFRSNVIVFQDTSTQIKQRIVFVREIIAAINETIVEASKDFKEAVSELVNLSRSLRELEAFQLDETMRELGITLWENKGVMSRLCVRADSCRHPLKFDGLTNGPHHPHAAFFARENFDAVSSQPHV